MRWGVYDMSPPNFIGRQPWTDVIVGISYLKGRKPNKLMK